VTRAERAQQVWRVLIGAAHNRQTVTYTMLANLIDMGPDTLAQPLELVARYCERNNLPPLTMLVVSKETGRPKPQFPSINRDRERVFGHRWFRLPPVEVRDFEQ
jgi:hypothetical protein